MKKSFVFLFFILILILPCVLGACGKIPNNTDTHTTHTYGAWITDTEPTCVTEGSMHRECTKCGEWDTDTIPALGHDFVDGICTRCGAEHCNTEGLIFTLQADDTYSVTDYTGSNNEVYISDTYNRKPITSIGSSAFQGCTGLESLTFAEHSQLTSIGEEAFQWCTGLTDITIPSSVTSIGSSAFYRCTGLTDITIPSSVTSIGDRALYWCTELESLTFAEHSQLTSIGEEAFSGCTGLTEITIPSSVTIIDFCAFYECTGLTDITIPNSVTSIGSSAFYGCTGLTDITIPSSVTSIGDRALYWCTELESLTFAEHSQLTSIGEEAFSGCTGLIKINCRATSMPGDWNSDWNDNCFATVIWGYTGE